MVCTEPNGGLRDLPGNGASTLGKGRFLGYIVGSTLPGELGRAVFLVSQVCGGC